MSSQASYLGDEREDPLHVAPPGPLGAGVADHLQERIGRQLPYRDILKATHQP
jgi:hypothetical protein